MKKRLFALLFPALQWAGLAVAQEPPVARVAALASGELRLNGTTISLTGLDEALNRLQQEKGVVWYYRENAQSDPPEQAMSALELVMKHRLPVSLSTKPDYSDYVDENGHSRPRKPQ
ncbi:hypothetical protein [Tahibacter caeni]|uniref:hypothetical protein n=1 Tax=Tahibacter caeni TaxID=1453545 RepID=UPI002147E60A|nr:hypothetical protein [Tahibacter caeni]